MSAHEAKGDEDRRGILACPILVELATQMILHLDVDACRQALLVAVGAARSILPFTGAGISTDAGIPDFRSPGSLWTTNKPVPFDAFVASSQVRKEAWRRKFAMDESFAGARPTPAHRLLAAWVNEGRAEAIVTQNIDGLHQAAGLGDDQVIELHGNSTYAKCLDCGARHELGGIKSHLARTGAPPACAACGGILKSATISFGQAMPRQAMVRAGRLAANCDLLLVIGSSLVVYPAATIPLMAKEAGARLVIVNRQATGLDEEADLVLRNDIAAVFAPLVAS